MICSSVAPDVAVWAIQPDRVLEGTNVALCGISQTLYGDVSVFYSGGLDSTSVACMAALKGAARVHLHTLNHGYGYLFASWAEGNVPALERALGRDRIVHRYVDIKDLFQQLAISTLVRDIREYRATFGCCMGCTMAITTETIIYNLEHGIPHIMMGSSVGGTYAAQSMPVTVGLQKKFCARYGIVYSTPLLDDNIVKAQERSLLRALGISPGVRFLDKHSFGNQGYCVPSLQHLGDVLLNVHPVNDPEQVARFFLDRQPRCETFIAEHFARRGQPLEPLIEALRSKTGLRETP